MDFKLIDFFRCPPVVVLDAFVSKRWDLKMVKPGFIRLAFTWIGICMSSFLFVCKKEWLVEFYRFVGGLVLLLASIFLHMVVIAHCHDPSYPISFSESVYNWMDNYLIPFNVPWLINLIACGLIQVTLFKICTSKFFYGNITDRQVLNYGYVCSTVSVTSAGILVYFSAQSYSVFVICMYISLIPMYTPLYLTLANFFASGFRKLIEHWNLMVMQMNEVGGFTVIEEWWYQVRVPQVMRLFFLFRLGLISGLLYWAYPVELSIEKEYHPIGFYDYFSSIFTIFQPLRKITNSTEESSYTYLVSYSGDINNLTLEAFKHTFVYQTCGVMNKSTTPVESLDMFQCLVAKLTDSLLSIFAVSAMMYVPLYYFEIFVHMVVSGIDANQASSLSIISAVLFCLLSIQTGLSGLPARKRLVRLVRNMWLLFSAVLHSVHELVSPVLIRISTQVNIPMKAHIRPLFVLFILFVLPFMTFWWLLKTEIFSTFMVAVLAFCIELVFKVLSTFLRYVLFTVDARVEHEPWQNLEDYVFWIKSTASVVEFICGSVMFVNGLYVFMFESSNLLRAFLMSMHAYLNIYRAACDGWKVFRNRRTVHLRISELQLASADQLLQHKEDVCCICYQDLTPGDTRVTSCGHLFHSACLRRWMFVQETCPMCHQKI